MKTLAELREIYRAECKPLFARDADISAAITAGLEAVRIARTVDTTANGYCCTQKVHPCPVCGRTNLKGF